MKYYANFDANNGTSWMHDMEFTNKAEAIREVRKCAEANRFVGNACKWFVYIVKNDSPRYIAGGGIFRDGIRYRLSKNELDCL